MVPKHEVLRWLGAENRVDVVRVPLAATACLVWLAGCTTVPPFGTSAAVAPADATTGAPALSAFAAAPSASSPATETSGGTSPGLLGSDRYDELSRGKKAFRESNYGLAEQHFRKAVEGHPNDGEAWLGLAASYDRLKRFDLADRAYGEVIRIFGPKPEVLNNQGFSYMLRGDYGRARQILRKAKARDPNNPYIRNNLKLLAKVSRGQGLE